MTGPGRERPRALEVLDVVGLVTVQDAGRLGVAHLGVPRAGYLDPPAARLAHRLVGNLDDAALLEVAGTVRVRLPAGAWVAVTGAPCEVRVAGRARSHGRAERVPAGGELSLGPARAGVRSYLAVAGGLDVEPVLGSRSTDTLAGVGPPRVAAGQVLPLGRPVTPPRALDVARPAASGPLRLGAGPRADWFAPGALARLCAVTWTVLPASDRVGLRLAASGRMSARAADAPALERTRHDELPSEAMVLGAVQVPPDGGPVVLLADHPTTGGYPVPAIVHADDVARCAQLRPGDEVGFVSRGP